MQLHKLRAATLEQNKFTFQPKNFPLPSPHLMMTFTRNNVCYKKCYIPPDISILQKNSPLITLLENCDVDKEFLR